MEALNISLEERIEILSANLERWRWLPLDLGEKYILVNIADFKLSLIEKKRPVFSTKAIVGKHYRKTPVFSAGVEGMIINPYWIVPRTILREDILPLGSSVPDYLKKENIKVINMQGQEMSSDSITWSEVDAREFGYYLRQDPGPLNALGSIKFLLPNHYSVYIHDTPSRGLFQQSKRTFSSGCIRIEHPYELAFKLLKGHPDLDWSEAKLLKVSSEKTNYKIMLPEIVPVHILYWTCWVDSNGVVNFREDVYHRDLPLIKALQKKPSVSGGL